MFGSPDLHQKYRSVGFSDVLNCGASYGLEGVNICCSVCRPGGDSDRTAAGREDSDPEGRGCSGADGEAEQGAEESPGGAGGSRKGQTQAQRRCPGGQDRIHGRAAGTGETVREHTSIQYTQVPTLAFTLKA